MMNRKLAICGIFVSCVLSGCTVGPKYHPPLVPQPPAFKETPANFQQNGPWTVAQPADALIRGDWWAIFNDPELNALEGQLNVNNLNIKFAFENYMQARAIVGEARALYFPTLTVDPSFTRTRTSGNTSNGFGTNHGGQQFNLYSLPFDASWAPDLFGRVRNTVRAAKYSAQISAADLENEKLIEQASLATFFFEIRGQDALIRLYADTVKTYQSALDLTQAQYDTGVTAYISVVEAKNTLQAAEATETNFNILRAQYEHAIAVLLGQPPSQFIIPIRPLTPAPPPIPIGVPSLLLERRPDIAAAERQMAVENANIGIAYAAFFPNLTLAASGGTQSSTIGHLLDWPSRVWSIGPSFSQPLFNEGLFPALHQLAGAYNADIDTYRQTVLTAFQQVEDSLAATRLLSEQIVQQTQAVQSAQQSVDLEMDRYKTGVDPYIDVVTLQNTLLADQQTLTNLQIEEMTSAVGLVQALGGGWDRSQLPTPDQTGKTPPKVDTRIKN